MSIIIPVFLVSKERANVGSPAGLSIISPRPYWNTRHQFHWKTFSRWRLSGQMLSKTETLLHCAEPAGVWLFVCNLYCFYFASVHVFTIADCTQTWLGETKERRSTGASYIEGKSRTERGIGLIPICIRAKILSTPTNMHLHKISLQTWLRIWCESAHKQIGRHWHKYLTVAVCISGDINSWYQVGRTKKFNPPPCPHTPFESIPYINMHYLCKQHQGVYVPCCSWMPWGIEHTHALSLQLTYP